jgi:hypothetical protein
MVGAEERTSFFSTPLPPLITPSLSAELCIGHILLDFRGFYSYYEDTNGA